MSGSRALKKWKALSDKEQLDQIHKTLNELSTDGIKCPFMKDYNKNKPDWMPCADVITRKFSGGKWSKLAEMVGLKSDGEGNIKQNMKRIHERKVQQEEQAMEEIIENVRNKRALYGNGIQCVRS